MKRYVNRYFTSSLYMGFVDVYLNLCACIGICMRVLEFVCVYWNFYACLYLWATVIHTTRKHKHPMFVKAPYNLCRT